MAGEVLHDRQHARAGVSGGRRDDLLGDLPGIGGGGAGADGGVSRARGHVGVRGEVDGEAQTAQLGPTGAIGLLRQGGVTGRAGAHEGREPGGDRSQPLDDPALLVDAEEERPRPACLPGERRVDARDLLRGDDVGVEGDDAAQVQAAHQVDRRGRASPLGHDDLPGQFGQAQPMGRAGGPVELRAIGTPTLAQSELLRGRRRHRGYAGRGGLPRRRPGGLLPVAGVARGERRDEDQGHQRGRQQGRAAAATGRRRAGRCQPGEHPVMVARPPTEVLTRGSPARPRWSCRPRDRCGRSSRRGGRRADVGWRRRSPWRR